MSRCSLCSERKAKRACPALGQEICARCCGEGREVTIRCALDCPWLQEAHDYERSRRDEYEMPFPQYELEEGYTERNEGLVAFLGLALLTSALDAPEASDADFIAALESAIRTRETLESGLIYESAPAGWVAEAIFRNLLEAAERLHAERQVKNAEVLRALVFFARLARAYSSPRPYAVGFYRFLRSLFPGAAAKTAAGIVIP